MEVRFAPDIEKRLAALAAKTGREPQKLLEEAIPYLEELASTQAMLDSRYDEMKSGRVTPIDGEAFFDELRRREAERLKRSPQ